MPRHTCNMTALAAALLAASLGNPALAGQDHPKPGHPPHGHDKTVSVKIIAFNDFHGQLESPGTFRASATSTTPVYSVGGADYFAGHIARLKAQNPHSVVVSAGDLIGATPLVSALFHDEPTIEVMNIAGLDFNAVGNHEFDEGKAELKRMQKGGCHPSDTDNTCKGNDAATA